MADAGATTDKKKDPLLRQGSHEIRNPTAVILGYARMLLTDRLGPLTDVQRKVVGDMEKSAARLAGLAKEMTQLAELMGGEARFVRGRVELVPLIAGEIPNVAPAPDRDVSIRIVDHAPAAALNGDATMLRQVLNSLMFSYRLEVVRSDELCVAIDRAPGIHAPAVRVTMAGADRIDEVRRLHESELVPLVEFRSGLGYRLSIARQVIEAHGGRIFSKTEPGDTPNASLRIIGAVMILPEF
jgi:signal transduction histidine kinase